MKKLVVNQDACVGCGYCVGTDPEHFAFDESDRSHVISQENVESANMQNIIESCPTGAIAYQECECENCECKKEEA